MYRSKWYLLSDGYEIDWGDYRLFSKRVDQGVIDAQDSHSSGVSALRV